MCIYVFYVVSKNLKPYELFFLAAFFFAAGEVAGRLLPNDPLNRFPFAVFLSPLPMVLI